MHSYLSNSILVVSFTFLISACGSGGSSAPAAKDAPMSEAAQLGEKIFKDTSLSASGRRSCESCHAPANGHASPFAEAVAMGGKNLDLAGTRLPPSIRYLRYNQAFRFDADGTARGGFNWDGRADSLADQAHRPFLSANEMANAGPADVVAKIAAAPYANQFKATFGATIFDDPTLAFERVTFALERYQVEDTDFAPFNSKYDAFVAGTTKFSEQELRGLAWFNRADKGNCAACHSSTKPSNAPGALFTDFSFDALGVPRNASIKANLDPKYFDQGLCASNRPQVAQRNDLCGVFKVPSLRNVATRTRFFHNGQFTSLEEVVSFYATRNTDPKRWYPLDDAGEPILYNDLPEPFKTNVNTSEGTYKRQFGQSPSLTASEIDDLVVFLKTLTDGYTALP